MRSVTRCYSNIIATRTVSKAASQGEISRVQAGDADGNSKVRIRVQPYAFDMRNGERRTIVHEETFAGHLRKKDHFSGFQAIELEHQPSSRLIPSPRRRV